MLSIDVSGPANTSTRELTVRMHLEGPGDSVRVFSQPEPFDFERPRRCVVTFKDGQLGSGELDVSALTTDGKMLRACAPMRVAEGQNTAAVQLGEGAPGCRGGAGSGGAGSGGAGSGGAGTGGAGMGGAGAGGAGSGGAGMGGAGMGGAGMGGAGMGGAGMGGAGMGGAGMGGAGVGGAGTIQLTVHFPGSGSGSILISPGAHLCPGECVVQIPRGDEITIDATPDRMSSLLAFWGACRGGTCRIVNAQMDYVVDVAFVRGAGTCADPTLLGTFAGGFVGEVSGMAGATQGTCGGSGIERVYAYTAPRTGTLRVELAAVTFRPVFLYVLDGGCGGMESTCRSSNEMLPMLTVDVPVMMGRTYSIVVDSTYTGTATLGWGLVLTPP